MNITQHTIFPNNWKLGQYRPNGFNILDRPFSLTHWFPLSTLGFRVFPMPSNVDSIYGVLIIYPSSGPFTELSYYTPLSIDGVLMDGQSVREPSKPFTYILY